MVENERCESNKIEKGKSRWLSILKAKKEKESKE